MVGRPKPAFQLLFQIATTRERGGVVLYNEHPPNSLTRPEDDSPCCWWRRGRDEVHLLKKFSKLLDGRNGVGVVVYVGGDDTVAISTFLKWAPGRDKLHLLKKFSKLLEDRSALGIAF